MYLTFDLAGPVLARHSTNLAFKRTLIKNWPVSATLINGHEVMDRVLYWNGTAYEEDWKKKLYKLMGTSVDKINKNEYKGIDYTWFEMKPFDSDEYVFTEADVRTLANSVGSVVATVGLIKNNPSSVLMVEPDINGDFPPVDNTQEYLDHFQASRTSAGFRTFTYDIEDSIAVAMLLADVDNELFDLETIVLGSSATTGQFNQKATTITYMIKYQLKAGNTVTTAYTARLNAMILPYLTYEDDDTQTVYSTVALELRSLYTTLYTPPDVLDVNGIPLFTYLNGKGYVTKAGLEATSANRMKDFFSKVLESDYEKETASIGARILSTILTIVAIVATIAALVTQQYWIVAAIQGAQFALQAYYVNNGDYAEATMVGKHMSVVQQVGIIISMVNIAKVGLEKGITEAATESLGYTPGMTTTQIATAILNNTNTVFNFYSKWEARETSDEISEYNEKISELEKQMASMPTPEQYELMKWDFESYNFLEINETMQQVPYTMTQGKLNSMTTVG